MAHSVQSRLVLASATGLCRMLRVRTLSPENNEISTDIGEIIQLQGLWLFGAHYREFGVNRVGMNKVCGTKDRLVAS